MYPFDFFAKMLGVILEKGWVIFFINLLVHVVLRGLWIGAIGLRYVSSEIDYDKLNYDERYTTYFKRKVGDYDDFIERLEKTCSVIFAYTFLLFLLMLSLITFFAITISFTFLSNKGLAGMLMLMFFVFGLVVFVDFITLGALKRIKDPVMSKIYMPLYRFYSTITLSFLYRPLLYNFIDNKYTRRLFFFSIPYIFVVLFSKSFIKSDAFPYWSSQHSKKYGAYISKMHYEDERATWYSESSTKEEFKKDKLPLVTLSQFVVDKPYLEIFLQMEGEDQHILAEKGIEPFHKRGVRLGLFSNDKYMDAQEKAMNEEKKKKLDAYKDRYKEAKRALAKDKSNTKLEQEKNELKQTLDSIRQSEQEKIDKYQEEKVRASIASFLTLNDVQIDQVSATSSMDCYQYRHPNIGEYGVLCLLPSDSLSNGRHMLSINRLRQYREGDRKTKEIKVPFYVAR